MMQLLRGCECFIECYYAVIHSKKCWVNYNPELGEIWTNSIGLF